MRITKISNIRKFTTRIVQIPYLIGLATFLPPGLIYLACQLIYWRVRGIVS